VSAIGLAYLVQGVIAAVGAVLVAALAQAGTPIEQQAGLLASGAAPWVLKVLLAVWLDLGRSWSLRLRAIVLAGLQLCAGACLWGLAAAWAERSASATDSLSTLTIIWITVNFIAASSDVLVDKLALDTLRGRQSWTAMAMGSGHAIGFGLLGSVLLGATFVEQGMVAGLRLPAWWIAIVGVTCGALLWLPGRPEGGASSSVPSSSSKPERDQNHWGRLLYIAVVFVALLFATNVLSAVSGVFVLVHLEWEMAEYTRLLLPIGTIAGIVGALAMGPLVAKLGPGRASMLAAGALGCIWLGFAASEGLWREPTMLPTFAATEGTLQSALLVGLHAIALIAVARSALPTTAFVLAMAALNLPRVLAPLVAPPMLVELDWVGLFVACGLFQLVAIAPLWPLAKWVARER
jgi:hypothetical protein